VGVPDQAPGGGPGRSSRGISGAPLDVCQPAPAQITTTSLSPGAPKGQACEGVDNGGTVLAGSGPRGSNSTVLESPPGARGGEVCPNLLQRPRSRRSTGRESLIFRASSRGRSRPGTPLQQIWTCPRPGPSQESHASHRASRRPTAASLNGE